MMVHTKGTWSIEKCKCGDANCDKWFVSCASSGGLFSKDDATLIAQSPTLLALLEEVVSAPPEGWTIKDAEDLHNRCKEAIAKAKGQG